MKRAQQENEYVCKKVNFDSKIIQMIKTHDQNHNGSRLAANMY